MSNEINHQINTDFYKNLLENIDEAVYFVDTGRQILFWNKKAEELTGYRQKDVISARCQNDLLDHVDHDGNKMCGKRCPLVEAIQMKARVESSLFLHHKDGHRLPVKIRSIPIQNPEGMVLGAVEIFSSISKQENDENKIKELAKLAYLDTESMLPNKNYIQMKWESVHTEFLTYNISYGVIFLDITNYREIVSSMGYEVSNFIISTVSKTVSAIGQTQHIIGRWGENVFAIILPSATKDMTQQFSKRYSRVTRHSSFHYKNMNTRINCAVKCFCPKENQTLKQAIEAVMRMPYMDE